MRPESEMRTAAGRNLTATHKQCKDYMRPFFKMCKNDVRVRCVEVAPQIVFHTRPGQELSPPILQAVRRIITNLEAREYVKVG